MTQEKNYLKKSIHIEKSSHTGISRNSIATSFKIVRNSAKKVLRDDEKENTMTTDIISRSFTIEELKFATKQIR